MSGYPKIWTATLHDPWFQSLTCLQRGLYLQMILLARKCHTEGQKPGLISATSMRDFGRIFAIERHTLVTAWVKFTQDGKINVVEKSPKKIVVELVNYVKWQSFRSQNEVKNSNQKWVKNHPRKCPNKNNTNVLFSAEGGLGFQPPASAWITDCPKERWKWIERKLAMPDSEYLKLFRRCVMEIDKIYVPGTIPKLERYKPGVVKKLIEIENRLDMIWTKAQGGKDVMPEFRDAVNDYYRFWKGNF